MIGVRKGFTLIEMLVAVSIFAIASSAATDLYIASNRAQRSVRAREKLQNEARVAMEYLAREGRTGAVDYASYGGEAPLAGNEFKLIDREGNPESFKLSSGISECAPSSHPCLLVCDALSCSSLTSKNIFVDELTFYITPQEDPFLFNQVSGEYAANLAPRITIFFKMHTESNLPEERAELTAQTTIASRVYKR